MADIVVDRCRISVDLPPPSDRPPLLLIHALGTTRELFAAQQSALGASLRLLRYDLRGHGRSEVPAQPCTLEQLGRDALAVLDAAGAERAHVLGVSIGGLAALWLALHAPERVDRLVLANTSARIGSRELWQDRIEYISRSGLGALGDQALARWFTEPFLRRAPAIGLGYRALLTGCSVKGYIGCCAALRDADLRDRVAEIRAPALVIVGAHDTATPPSDGERLAKQIAEARLVTLPSAHLSNVECADAFNGAVLDFLS
jgi:3-oxoadipate enol-lactonase